MRHLSMTCLIALSTLLTACGSEGNEPQSQANASTAPWLLESEPADAQSVSQVKATAKEGDHVVVRARIGGRAEPITEGSPVFTIMDLSIAHCGENPGDGCPTPWDYCCETPETIKTNAATVQVVDAEGQPVKTSLSAAGLQALDEVILVGSVGPRASEEVLTIAATGVYRSGG